MSAALVRDLDRLIAAKEAAAVALDLLAARFEGEDDVPVDVLNLLRFATGTSGPSVRWSGIAVTRTERARCEALAGAEVIAALAGEA